MRNLTINSSVSLIINTGVTVTVAGNIPNNGNGLTGMGTIQFNKNTSTLQLSGNSIGFEGIVDVAAGTTLNTNGRLTLTASTKTSYWRITGSTGVITGNVTVQKILANTNAGWRQISLPMDAPLTSIVGIDLNLYRLRTIDFDGSSELSTTLRVAINNALVSGIRLYPIPVSDHLIVDLTEFKESFTCTIIDANGRELKRGTVTRNKQRIGLQELKPGVYFFKTEQSGAIRFVK